MSPTRSTSGLVLHHRFSSSFSRDIQATRGRGRQRPRAQPARPEVRQAVARVDMFAAQQCKVSNAELHGAVAQVTVMLLALLREELSLVRELGVVV